jgi:hypothetical protein
MRVISTRVHGVIDYLYGAALAASPWLFGFADGTAAQWTAIVLGAGTILFSLLTRYELGLMKLIPMPLHLVGDLSAGALLLASPVLLGFADRVLVPYLVFGVMPFIVVPLSERQPRSLLSA